MNLLAAAGDVQRFRVAVERRLGLAFGDDKRGMLAEILHDRAGKRSESTGLYLHQLEGSGLTTGLTAELSAEWKLLGGLLTVSETYFFRHYEQFRAFAEVALETLALAQCQAQGLDRRLSILSAGCASGEETYSLAMMAREAGLDGACELSILGVDVNGALIEKALEGRYSTWALRETSPERRDRWFRSRGRDYVVDDSIRRMVRFEERNLADDDREFWRAQRHDVIFCRNMLMYLSPPSAQALVQRLAQCLAPGGHLFLGYAENLRGLSQEFHLCHTHETFYYRKRRDGEPGHRPELFHAVPRGPIGTPEAPTTPDLTWMDAIGRAAERIRVLSGEPVPEAGAYGTAKPGAHSGLGEARDLLRLERFDEALSALGPASGEADEDTETLLLKAVLLVHKGQLAQAREACQRLLELDELNSGAQYTLALCCEGMGDAAAAVSHHQSAVYLDPAFAMPHLQLGLIARRSGDHDGARIELQQALVLLQREESARLLLFAGGFSREALLELCRSELGACGAGS